MLKLLLKEDRINLKKEYTLRFFILFFTSIIILQIVWGLLMLIPYYYFKNEKEVFSERLADMNREAATIERNRYSEVTNEILEKVQILKKPQSVNSNIIDIIFNNIENISISNVSINYANSDIENYANISVKGVADSRDSLLQYEKKLQENELVNTTFIPLSNFTKSENLQFEISIKTNNID